MEFDRVAGYLISFSCTADQESRYRRAPPNSYLHTASTDKERKTEFFTQPDDEPRDKPSPNRAGTASSGQENHVSAIAETPYLGAYLQTLSGKVTNMSPSCSLSFHLWHHEWHLSHPNFSSSCLLGWQRNSTPLWERWITRWGCHTGFLLSASCS